MSESGPGDAIRLDLARALEVAGEMTRKLSFTTMGTPQLDHAGAIALALEFGFDGIDIRCADYATFGSPQLSAFVLQAIRGRKACLMAHHGMTCFEKDLPGVLALAIEVEHLAAVYSRILAIGGAEVLSDDEMAVVLEKFKSYGVQDS